MLLEGSFHLHVGEDLLPKSCYEKELMLCSSLFSTLYLSQSAECFLPANDNIEHLEVNLFLTKPAAKTTPDVNPLVLEEPYDNLKTKTHKK